MVTVRRAIDRATERLSAVGSGPNPSPSQSLGRSASQSARLDAEVLLMHVLGCDLTALITHPERPLSFAQSARYDAVLERRAVREPIQYITGEQEFFGLAMKVTPDVLIPRPETEHLVEALLDRMDREAAVQIVDVGTGSGAIAVVLAHSLPHASVTAVDLSEAALDVAGENAAGHGVSGRVRLLRSDLLAGVKGERFDAVVSNPPYIADGETLEPQVCDYEPHSALYAGPTGFEIYQRLIPQAYSVLRPGGWLLLEIGYGQRPAISELLSDWDSVSFLDDLQAIPRVAVARRPGAA